MFLCEIDIQNTKILFGIRLNLTALEILANSLLNTHYIQIVSETVGLYIMPLKLTLTTNV